VATDYTPLVTDMLCAYGATPFDWYYGAFAASRTHDVGSLGWPWEFRHEWTVTAPAATRNALLRQGWVEAIPTSLRGTAGGLRLSSKALALAATYEYGWRSACPSWTAYRAAADAAEADRKAHPGVRQRL
jgi:hypothetical protein